MKTPAARIYSKIPRLSRRTPRRYPEEALCKAIHSWNLAQKPKCLAFHVPNGGKRNRAEAGKFKAMGVLAGVFDWVVLMPPLPWDTLPRTGFVECKAGRNDLTDGQKEFRERVEVMGFETAECRSLDEWRQILTDWGVTWRGQKFDQKLNQNLDHKKREQV